MEVLIVINNGNYYIYAQQNNLGYYFLKINRPLKKKLSKYFIKTHFIFYNFGNLDKVMENLNQHLSKTAEIIKRVEWK